VARRRPADLDEEVTSSFILSGRTSRQLDLAEHGAAVLVDGQMYRVVGVETHQLYHAAENLHTRTHIRHA